MPSSSSSSRSGRRSGRRTHECNVSEPWRALIGSGAKDVEGRLCKGTFAELRAGDRLIVRGGPGVEAIETRVVAVRKYGTFKRYLEAEGLRHTLPGVETVAKGVAVYRAFYTKEQEAEHGIVAVEIRSYGAPGLRR